MLDSVRDRLFKAWSSWVCRHAGKVLLAAALTVGASLAYTVTSLGFQSDRNALLSPDLSWNRKFEDWRASFPGTDDIYVVIDSGNTASPGRADRVSSAKAMAQELGEALRANENIAQALWGFETDAFSPRSLRLLPLDEFESRLQEIMLVEPVLASRSLQALLANAAATPGPGLQDGQLDAIETRLVQMTGLIDAVDTVISTPPNQRPSLEALLIQDQAEPKPWQPLVSENGRLYFIRVTPKKAEGTINALLPAISATRALISETLARYPGLEAGLTGIDVIETDETDAATRDSAVASAIASILIAVLMISAYGSWRTPLLAMVALLTGVVWSFGFLTLAIGHLQVLSVVFVVILMGLGVAYGVHQISHLELARHAHPDTPQGFEACVSDSLLTVGPGVVTGAITTAAAFCTTMGTDFRGVAEMGAIAGAGVILCLIAMLSVFPALLRRFAFRHRDFTPVRGRRLTLFHEAWITPFVRHPQVTLWASGVLVTASIFATTRLEFDYDLMNLQPRGVDSVEWQERVVRDGQQAIWTAAVVAESLDEAERLKKQLLALSGVDQVGGVGLLFPDDEPEKLARLSQLRERFNGALQGVLEPDVHEERGLPKDGLRAQLVSMQWMIRTALQGSAPAGLVGGLERLDEGLTRVLATMSAQGTAERERSLRVLQAEYEQFRRSAALQIKQALDPTGLRPADLPVELMRPYLSASGPLSGRYVLEVHPRLPKGVTSALDPDYLPGFIEQLEAVSPYVTGVISQVYYSGHLIQNSYQLAGLYALAVVFLLVWADFRSLGDALLCLVPVAVGFAVTFGVMSALGMSINPANIIVLPLMFGIGVDSGVHILHRYRQSPSGSPPGLTSGTGKGITITSLTTMIGFGSMLMARHRGIASLGFVLSTGIGMTLLACLTVMPAWLALRNRRATAGQPGATAPGG